MVGKVLMSNEYGGIVRLTTFLARAKRFTLLLHKADNPVQANIGSFFNVMLPQSDYRIAVTSQLPRHALVPLHVPLDFVPPELLSWLPLSVILEAMPEVTVARTQGFSSPLESLGVHESLGAVRT